MSTFPENAPGASRPQPWLLAALGLALMAAVFVVVCRPWDLTDGFMIGAPIGRDFANMWLGGRLALDGQLNLLIELPAYKELFSRTFAHNPEDTFVFSYPPHSLLLLAPFATLPFGVAVWLWTALNLACIAWAARLLADQTAVPESGLPLALLACLSPAALTMAAFGHFGGMLGLMAILFFTRADSRPMLAGACLALTSIKPQFAVLFGVLLIITGHWRVVLWSMPATLVLVVLSVLAFGVQPWVNFVTWTVPFHGQLFSGTRLAALGMVISPYAGLLLLDAPGWLAQVVQYTFSAVVMARAAQLLLRHGVEPRTLALGLLATIAALPYVNGYDLAVAAAAMTVALFAPRPDPPALPTLPLAALWLLAPLTIPFGILQIPLVQPIFAAALLAALFWHAQPAAAAAARPT